MANIVIKSTLNGKFTIISNEFARNPEVTPRAAKVYNYLMSNTEGWETSGDRVAKIIGMSPGAVLSALNDLEELGYLVRKRVHGDGGKFNGMEYHLYAESSTIHQKTMNGETTDGQTTNGETTDGKLGDIRRQSFKKTNTQEDQCKGEGSGPGPKQGSRLPENWSPPQRVWDSMAEKFPDIDIEDEHESFKEYWLSKAGKDATKLDWSLTWQSWMRRANKWAQPRRQSGVDQKLSKMNQWRMT